MGERSFGEGNEPVYAKRHRPDYYEQSVEVEGGRFLWTKTVVSVRYMYMPTVPWFFMMASDNSERVRVFTPDHHFISADCTHLTRSGARYIAGMIDWK